MHCCEVGERLTSVFKLLPKINYRASLVNWNWTVAAIQMMLLE